MLPPLQANTMVWTGCIIIIFILIIIGAAIINPLPKYTKVNTTLTPLSRTREREKLKEIKSKKSIEILGSLLRRAVVTKVYQVYNKVYTLPLDRKEAVLYIWAQVLKTCNESERDFVIRMAAYSLKMFEEFKTTHILELEAAILKGFQIYGGAGAVSKLLIRAVNNVEEYEWRKKMSVFIFLEKPITANSVDFPWPESVANSVSGLKQCALDVIDQSDLASINTFPCVVCKCETSVTELVNLKCSKCRKL